MQPTSTSPPCAHRPAIGPGGLAREARAELRRRLVAAVAVAVLQHAHHVGALGEAVRLAGERAAQERDAVGDGAQRLVVAQPAGLLRDVEHRVQIAVGLANEQPALRVDRERDRVLEQRLGGNELRSERCGELELGQLGGGIGGELAHDDRGRKLERGHAGVRVDQARGTRVAARAKHRQGTQGDAALHRVPRHSSAIAVP
jgi:hypothetical protein